jgi:hypothetical protein
MASDSKTSVTLTTFADPPTFQPGFSVPDHVTEMDNKRSSKIYDVDIYSVSVHKMTELDGHPDVIESYPVIKSGRSKVNRYSISIISGNSGKTEEIQTTAEYYDETQPTTREDLDTIYDIDIP